MEEIKNVKSMENSSPVQDSSNEVETEIAFNEINVQEEIECSAKESDGTESDVVETKTSDVSSTEVFDAEEDTAKDEGDVIELKVTEPSDSSNVSRIIVEPDDSEDSNLPPISLPNPSAGYVNDISVFCISQQGESHVKNEIPCQDRSAFRWVNDQILITAIADGVGSCQLSDYGADTAVKSSLDYLVQYFTVATQNADFVFDVPEKMKAALSGAMQYAYDSVEKYAEELEVLSYSMQSTLTVTVYDGKTLYFSHAGDDGIVALNKDGVYAMVTARIKGEEASSVFPLQSKQWYYGKVNDAVAFVMATDGVLDAFVRPLSENNRVYYRFIEPVFYTRQTDLESAKANCDDWDEYLKSSTYRNVVTDDITFVGVVNQEAIKTSKKPMFDDNEWNKQTEEYEKKRRAALYPPQTPKKQQTQKNSDAANSIPSARVSYPGYAGNSSYSGTGNVSNPYTGNKVRHGVNGKNSTQMPETSKRKPGFNENRDMLVNGTKQTVSGLADVFSAVVATTLEMSGEVFAAMGEMNGQFAVKIKQNRMNKNQQNSNDDSVKKNFPKNTDQ